MQLKSRAENAAIATASQGELDSLEAQGHINAGGAQLGEDGKVLLSMDLQGERLIYTTSDKKLVVPGRGNLTMIDNRPKTAENKTTQGTSAFQWDGSMVYDGGPGNKITFARNVVFYFKPVEPWPFLKEASSGSGSKTKPATRPAAATQATSPAKLTTQNLVAYLLNKVPAKGTTTVKNPLDLGAQGNMDVDHVEATGGADLDVSDYKLSGEKLTYAKATQKATVTGEGEDLVVIRKGREQSAQGTQIDLDMSQDKFFLEIKNFRGVVMSGMRPGR